MTENKCPLCKQTVSQELFEKITGIWRERRVQEKALKDKQKDLTRQLKDGKKALEEERRRLKQEQRTEIDKKVADHTKKFSAQLARVEAQKNRIQSQSEKKISVAVKAAERKARLDADKVMKAQLDESVKKAVNKAQSKQSKDLYRAQRTIDSTRKQMTTLQQQSEKQRIKINNLEIELKNKTTPQIEGLLYEDKLIEALKKDFPYDKFTHTGKGGDILQEVFFEKNSHGLIIYECKKVTHWSSAHLEQAYQARIQRKADYAILVTNAPKKGAGGFFIEKDVIVINPAGVLAIAGILRDQIIKMSELRLTKAQKDEAIDRTLKYLQGAEFKNALDFVIKKTKEMYEDLKEEYKDHLKMWQKRYDSLKSVYTHTAQVQNKTTALVAGKFELADSKENIQPFPSPLSLPDLR